MSNATQENGQHQTDTREVCPDEGQAVQCPAWCIDTGKCMGDHVGKAWGTVATGGFPPEVYGPDAPTYNTAVVRAQYPESDGLAPGVALFGAYLDRDWQVDLTLKEAGILLAGLQAAIDTARSA